MRSCKLYDAGGIGQVLLDGQNVCTFLGETIINAFVQLANMACLHRDLRTPWGYLNAHFKISSNRHCFSIVTKFENELSGFNTKIRIKM